MKYSDFLLIENRTDVISLESAVKIYKDHCSNTPLDDYFLRSVEFAYRAAVIDPSRSERDRKPKGGDVIAMYILDEIMKDRVKVNPPIRSKCLIMATQANIGHILKGMFGKDIYHVIPFNDSTLAYVEEVDYNYSRKLSSKWRYLYDYIDDDDIKSYKDIIKMLENNNEITPKKLASEIGLKGDYKSYDVVLKELYKLEDLDIHIVNKSKEINKDKAYEVWTSGKCLLIKDSMWKEFLELVKD